MQQAQSTALNQLSQDDGTRNGIKRSSITPGFPKKKKKKGQFKQPQQQPSDIVKPTFFKNPKSPFKTVEEWNAFRVGNCPNHGKSENGYRIGEINWYWRKRCKKKAMKIGLHPT